jgi:hypothetical protein
VIDEIVARAMLDTDGVDGLAEEIVQTVRAQGAEAGFVSLFKPSGSGRIRGLGVAMGTKLLYFACRDDSDAGGPTPLVYDQWVYAGLDRLSPADRPSLADGRLLPSPKRWVSAAAYGRWCGWAKEQAAERPGVRAEDVEFALFAEGNPGIQPRGAGERS